jgi:antitoxin VapB
MALNIKNAEAERLARELARQAGESVTEAIRKALEDRLKRVKVRRVARSFAEDVQDILSRVDALPILDTRSEEQILKYDEHGIPRSW